MNRWLQLFINNVELVLITQQSPDHRRDLANDDERNRHQRAEDAQGEVRVAQTNERERTHGTNDIQVDIDSSHVTYQKIQRPVQWNGTHRRENHIERSDRQGHPRVESDAQADARSKRQTLIVRDEQDALQPTLALFDEVAQCERTLLPHFA